MLLINGRLLIRDTNYELRTATNYRLTNTQYLVINNSISSYQTTSQINTTIPQVYIRVYSQWSMCNKFTVALCKLNMYPKRCN